MNETERAPSSLRALSVAAVGVLVVIGIGFRFVTRSALWLDEALSVNIARLPLGDIAPWLKHDGAPPLYYWMLHGWTAAFGTSDAAVRSLSGLFGVAALPLAYACGKRVGGRTTAWIAVVVLAVNPYAIRFATETRMYGFEIFLTFAGILTARRAFERADVGRLALVAVVSAALVWTHYWCLSLVGAFGLVVLYRAWRTDGAERRTALKIAGATAIGGLTFILWIPTFIYQSQHTGTPWATAQLPPIPIGRTLLEFAGGDHSEGWVLVYLAVSLLVLGVFGHLTERHTIEIDVHTHSSVTAEAVVGVLGLGFGATVAYVGGSGFQPRYSAAILPFFVIVLARGISLFSSPKVRAGLLAVVVVTGVAGGLRNVTEQRTQTAAAAATVLRSARNGDLVVYCPDQLGPATNRVLSRDRSRTLTEIAYPSSRNVKLIDWVDYVERLDAVTPQEAARTVLAFAPSASTIFVVTAPGYITHDARCPAFVDALGELGNRRARVLQAIDPELFEKAGVIELTTRPRR